MLYGSISFWWLPVISAATWFGTLLAMLIVWLTKGHPIYPSMEAGQTIAYISDIGATGLKPLFIAGSAVSVVVFDLAFLSERWLRHKGRLAHNRSWVDKSLSLCAIIFSIVGAAGLILLTIFDTRRYPNAHDAFLVVFIAGYIISAIFICAEYQRLGIYFRDYKILRMSFWIKLFFIIVEIALAIAFGVMQKKDHYNTAAVLEWTISLIYIIYVLSFVMDFWPATKTKDRENRFPTYQSRDREDGMAEVNGPSVSGGPVYSEAHSGRTSYASNQPFVQSQAQPGSYAAPAGNEYGAPVNNGYGQPAMHVAGNGAHHGYESNMPRNF